MEVMRHLPTPSLPSFDSRSSYHPYESRRPCPPIDKDQSHCRPYAFTFRYPPSPPMERQCHTSLPPISTLLANMRESQGEQERAKREATRLEASRIDPRLNGPPTPPSQPQRPVDAPRSAPLQPSPATAPHQPAHSYPTPHESRQGSISSYAGRSTGHRHQLSSSSNWSAASARIPSPQSASAVESTAARASLYPPPPMVHQRSVPEYSPRTPQSPPTTSTPGSHVSDYDRHWQPVPQPPPHHHQPYAGVPPPGFTTHGPPGTSTLHLSPVSAQPQTHPDRYVCPQCAKAFSRPSSLRIHVHSHTGEKPFVCPHTGCGKAFSVRSNMKRHQRGCHVDGASGKEIVDDAEPHSG